MNARHYNGVYIVVSIHEKHLIDQGTDLDG